MLSIWVESLVSFQYMHEAKIKYHKSIKVYKVEVSQRKIIEIWFEV